MRRGKSFSFKRLIAVANGLCRSVASASAFETIFRRWHSCQWADYNLNRPSGSAGCRIRRHLQPPVLCGRWLAFCLDTFMSKSLLLRIILTIMDQDTKRLLIGSVGMILYGVIIITCPRFNDLIGDFVFAPLFHFVEVALRYIA
jgi:hypothetical protein